jgi:hypothetical protein
MIRCKRCQHLNDDDAVFCANCKAYLEWEGDADRGSQAGVHVELLGHDDLDVEPGEEANCEIEVHNTGTATDAF